jgi:tRNA (mo5U34)-methyltransferase
MVQAAAMSTGALRAEVDALPWYHTIELPGGVVTPGEYDHRATVGKVPLPERLDGRRCLDVGTHDGFWAFEMERRGASEVVAIDVERPDDIDWPEPRPQMTEELRTDIAKRKRAFEVARDALGSKVDRRFVSVYDLDRANEGTFDVAFLGTLLHHLRDPIGALQGVRRVVDGRLVLVAIFSPLKTALLPFTPVTELLEYGGHPFYEMPNIAGLRRQLELGGWEIEKWGRVHLQGYGAGWVNAPLQWRGRINMRTFPRQLLLRRGAMHISVLARPR